MEKEQLFAQLQKSNQSLAVLSLLKEKKTVFSPIPFKKTQVKCKKLVEKY